MATTATMAKYPAKEHARRVARAMNVTEGLLYLQAPCEDSYNDLLNFSQDRFFYYLSGCNETDFHLTYDIAMDQLNLYLPSYGLSHAYFYGTKNTIADAMQRYDIDGAAHVSDLSTYMTSWSKKSQRNLYILDRPQATLLPPIRELLETLLRAGRLDFHSLEPAMTLCRLYKDSYEIALIREANDISAKAHTAVLRNIRTYNSERQIEAKFVETCIASGAQRQAYSVIAAAGVNGTTLHYSANDSPLRTPGVHNQMVVLDAGAEYQNYASDVTRTFPLTGHWPSAQCKAIYECVQAMQDAAVQNLRPGNSARDTALAVQNAGIEGLLGLGILKGGNVQDIMKQGTLRAFFPHGLGHQLGLDVHDVVPDDMQVGSCDINQPLPHGPRCPIPLAPGPIPDTLSLSKQQTRTMIKPLVSSKEPPIPSGSTGVLSKRSFKHAIYAPGMVLTIEPGLYFNPYILEIYKHDAQHARYIDFDMVELYLHVGGCRIEDDFHVTDEFECGWENLTTAPKGEDALRIIRGEERSDPATLPVA